MNGLVNLLTTQLQNKLGNIPLLSIHLVHTHKKGGGSSKSIRHAYKGGGGADISKYVHKKVPFIILCCLW